MAQMIFIKFCVYCTFEPQQNALSAFPGNFRETRKIVFNFLSVA